MSLIDLLQSLAGDFASSPDSPGTPGGTGPWDSAPPIAAGPGGPSQSSDDDSESGGDGSGGDEEAPPGSWEALKDAGAKAIDDSIELFDEVTEVMGKSPDELTEDEKIALGAEDVGGKDPIDFLDPLIEKIAPPAAAAKDAAEYGAKAAKAGYEGYKAVKGDPRHDVIDSLKDAKGESDLTDGGDD